MMHKRMILTSVRSLLVLKSQRKILVMYLSITNVFNIDAHHKNVPLYWFTWQMKLAKPKKEIINDCFLHLGKNKGIPIESLKLIK